MDGAGHLLQLLQLYVIGDKSLRVIFQKKCTHRAAGQSEAYSPVRAFPQETCPRSSEFAAVDPVGPVP